MRTDRGHGSPWDRGAADAWYHRPRNPHYFTDRTYASEKITEESMTMSEISEYLKGYEEMYDPQGGKQYD